MAGLFIDVFVDGILMHQHMITCEWHEMQETTFALREGKKRVKIMLPNTFIFALTDIRVKEGAAFAPVPKRGKTNHSGYMHYTAEKAASLLQMDYEDFCEQEVKNAKTLLGIR